MRSTLTEVEVEFLSSAPSADIAMALSGELNKDDAFGGTYFVKAAYYEAVTHKALAAYPPRRKMTENSVKRGLWLKNLSRQQEVQRCPLSNRLSVLTQSCWG